MKTLLLILALALCGCDLKFDFGAKFKTKPISGSRSTLPKPCVLEWRVGQASDRRELEDEALCQAWADEGNRLYGRGTHTWSPKLRK